MLMKKMPIPCAVIVLLLAGVITGLALAFYFPARAAQAAQMGEGKIIHVVEHAITDTVQQFHPPANSLGDTLGFHNPVFDAANKKQVGYDNGFCIRSVATGKTEWECNWSVFLKGGHITVEGPYYDDGTDTTLSIIGGTGIYSGAKGQMILHARGNPLGSEYDFLYQLS
jgi:allene oxide cyclase